MTQPAVLDAASYEIKARSVTLVGPHRQVSVLRRGDALPDWISTEQFQRLYDDDNLDHYGRI